MRTTTEWLALVLAFVNLLATAAAVGAAYASLKLGQLNLAERIVRLEQESDRHKEGKR